MKVILLDDHQTFRESLAVALRHEGSIDVVGEAGTSAELFALLERQPADLVVSDLILKAEDGIAVCRKLMQEPAAPRVLILTMHSNPLFVRDAFDAGALGYALKEQPLAEIVQAMRSVLRGNRYVSPLLGPVNLGPAERTGLGHGPQGLDRLSAREREIFALIVRGLSSKSIGESLHISIKTVETHRTHINRKLGIRSPADLIRLAALKGLLTDPALSIAEPAAGRQEQDASPADPGR